MAEVLANPADRIMQRLMETHIDNRGREYNGFADDLTGDVKDLWLKKYGKDIEESLHISGYTVAQVIALVPEVLIDWAFPAPRKGDRADA